ncbi:MAG TPA: hypothetical protein EYO54_04420 [Candidatus Marinimicrobia bacterium]|nr:hypothetical protein [Candidatus Neomarinimicrobiota bacterium]
MESESSSSKLNSSSSSSSSSSNSSSSFLSSILSSSDFLRKMVNIIVSPTDRIDRKYEKKDNVMRNKNMPTINAAADSVPDKLPDDTGIKQA